MCVGVVLVSQVCPSRRDADSYAHAQVNVSAVTALIHVLPQFACTHKILLKTAILSNMGCDPSSYDSVYSAISPFHLVNSVIFAHHLASFNLLFTVIELLCNNQSLRLLQKKQT